MQGRPRALLASDHGEMILMAVQVRHEDYAGLVEAGGRLEDVPRQRHRRTENVVESSLVASGKPRQRIGGGGRDGVEDTEQRVRMALRIARDQFGVVEVVPSVH